MDLTIIGFVIAVVGIVLQLADAFPEHRETRKALVFMTLGIFVGIVVSAVLGANYNVTGNVDRRFALLYLLAGVAVFFGLIAVLVSDKQKQEIALIFTACAGGIFLLSGVAVALGSIEGHVEYSSDEILILANAAESGRQYELAIERLKQLQGRLEDKNARDIIGRRISRIEALRVGSAEAALQ